MVCSEGLGAMNLDVVDHQHIALTPARLDVMGRDVEEPCSTKSPLNWTGVQEFTGQHFDPPGDWPYTRACTQEHIHALKYSPHRYTYAAGRPASFLVAGV